jgi:hypothetical protein
MIYRNIDIISHDNYDAEFAVLKSTLWEDQKEPRE